MIVTEKLTLNYTSLEFMREYDIPSNKGNE